MRSCFLTGPDSVPCARSTAGSSAAAAPATSLAGERERVAARNRPTARLPSSPVGDVRHRGRSGNDSYSLRSSRAYRRHGRRRCFFEPLLLYFCRGLIGPHGHDANGAPSGKPPRPITQQPKRHGKRADVATSPLLNHAPRHTD